MPALVLAIIEAFAKAGAAAAGSAVGRVAGEHLAKWIAGQPETDRAALSAAVTSVLAAAHAFSLPGAASYGGMPAGSAIPPAGQGS